MSTPLSGTLLPPARDTRLLIGKWVIALLIPLMVFTFVWNGEVTINHILLGFFLPNSAVATANRVSTDLGTLLGATIFLTVLYCVLVAIVGYAVAADTGKQGAITLWITMLVFTVVPLLLIYQTDDLFIGLSLSVLVWLLYALALRLWRRFRPSAAASTLTSIGPLTNQQRTEFVQRATMGGFWFGAVFAAISLVIDLLYFFIGQYGDASTFILIWIIVRTVLLPIIGYVLGRVGGLLSLRYTLRSSAKNGKNLDVKALASKSPGNVSPLSALSATRAREEAQDLVPNDLPLRSRGARNFYMLLLFVFLLCYPMLDPFLFGGGTNARLAQYGDAGRYVILALGLNIVVGFAGLLDLGYVAFFVFGAYTWAMVGSPQLQVLTGLAISPGVLAWLFWPMLLVAALIAALWGVLLGAPTLRLRGDYLAIVTLGFGEIIPIVVRNLDKYTGGSNGLSGISPPAFFGIEWDVSTPMPYYYLMLFLIALVLLANVRLRDSRLGRAWVAIREDEIAAASSGINLVKTKLFAFGAGAFFSGIAGAYFVAKATSVDSTAFSFGDSVLYLSMVVLGGLGSIPGVVVGALAVYLINEPVLKGLDSLGTNGTGPFQSVYGWLQGINTNFSFSNLHYLIFGTILILVMIFRPEGLIPSARRRRELHETRDGEEKVDVLDIAPGAPGFEEEIHVE